MKVFVILLVASVLVASIDGRKACNSVVDCACGSQCVSRVTNVPCRRGSGGRNCECRRGCVVGNIFIAAGQTKRNTYCNTCTCPQNSARAKGIAGCSRRAWCGMPRGKCSRRAWCGMPRGKVYLSNPKC